MKLTEIFTPFVIAIDGPAASGKSTLAEKLAVELGFLYFDTGVMYRAVTLAALDELDGVDDEDEVTRLAEQSTIDVQPASCADGRKMDVLLNGSDVTWKIRSHEIDLNVSKVSAYREVRKALTDKQRVIGLRGKVVMVGRDIGTVVFPDAACKLYLDASPEERARRRHAENEARGKCSSYDEILRSIRRRDRIDSTREHAPLKAAADAVIIDTDGKTAEEVLQESLAYIREKCKNQG